MDPGNPISLKKSAKFRLNKNIIAIENKARCKAIVYPLAKARYKDTKKRINEKIKRARKIRLASMFISSQSSRIFHSFCDFYAQQVSLPVRILGSI